MLVHKSESPEIARRQIHFFGLLEEHVPKIQTIYNEGYCYKFIPGVPCRNPLRAYDLLTNVWQYGPLEWDNISVEDYVSYIESLCIKHSIDFDLNLLSLPTDTNCLVHGDATLENFIQGENSLIMIDPGQPRGLAHRVNDIAKLCQSYLTHWEVVKYKTDPIPMVLLPVDSHVLSALACHWIRILKNADRHHPRIERYGREHVLPTLKQSLQIAATFSGPGRYAGLVKRIYDRLLPASIQAGYGA